MQVPRQGAPLGFLQLQVLLRQAAVFGDRTGELHLGRAPQRDLAARLADAAHGEPHQAHGQHQKDRG